MGKRFGSDQNDRIQSVIGAKTPNANDLTQRDKWLRADSEVTCRPLALPVVATGLLAVVAYINGPPSTANLLPYNHLPTLPPLLSSPPTLFTNT